MKPSADIDRRRELARIHCLKKELKLDDEAYRAVLWAVGRVDSSAQLDSFGRKAVIMHMESHAQRRRDGSRPTRPAPSTNPADYNSNDAGCEARAARAAPDKQPLMLKISDLAWRTSKSSWYVDGMSKRMFQVDRYEWCTPDQLRKIVSALNYHYRRKAA